MLKSKFIVHSSWFIAKSQNIKSFVLIYVFVFSVLNFALICFAQQEFKYDSKGKRNPFIPLVTSEGRLLKLDKEETASDLSIQGIIYDKQGRSYAIVNNSVVGVGDIIGDYQVLKVEENKVVFIKEGQLTEIEIHKEGE